MAIEHEEDESQQEQPPKRTKTLPPETLENLQSIHILLPEIVMEILSRLSVESLLRCKSVCKSWRSLISDPRFVKYHLSMSRKDTDHAHQRLILWTGSRSVMWCPLYDVIYDKSVNLLEVRYPLEPLQMAVLIARSCNGLLCICVKDGDEETVCIWNPSTRQSKRLPYSGINALHLMEYGFGYEESSDDYKVVSISWASEDKANNDIMVMIYSLNSGNWKRIGDFPNHMFVDDSGVFFNGALHWVGKSLSSSRTIVSIDLATKTYGEVLQPVYDEGDKELYLGVLGEWLCLECYYDKYRKTDVWVMKDYGVKDSWTKLASIQNPESFLNQFWGPLIIANDGKILMHCGNELVLYDAKNHSSSEIKRFVRGYALVTVESLVSPNGPRELTNSSEDGN